MDSSLSIPKYSNPLQDELNPYWEKINKKYENDGEKEVRKLLDFLFDENSPEQIEELMNAVRVRLGSPTSEEEFLQEEWITFISTSVETSKDFETKHSPVHESLSSWIDQVVQVNRLREVRALRGFTRVDYHQEGEQLRSSLSRTDDLGWLPAVEIRGEGIFVRLRQDAVEKWESQWEVNKRSERLLRSYQGSRYTALRLLLVHTLSHLLMRELSLTAGYSSTSIRERLYVGNQMCGFLLYTGSADSDGSLGGLVQHAETKRFRELLDNALETARFCSFDPLCSEHMGGVFGKLYGAACYACSLVSETTCEEKNLLLDRGLVIQFTESG